MGLVARRLLFLLAAGLLAGGCRDAPEVVERQLVVRERLVDQMPVARPKLRRRGVVTLDGGIRRVAVSAAKGHRPEVDCGDGPMSGDRICTVRAPSYQRDVTGVIVETAPLDRLRRQAGRWTSAAGSAGAATPAAPDAADEAPGPSRRSRLLPRARTGEDAAEWTVPAWQTPAMRAWPIPLPAALDLETKPLDVPEGSELSFWIGIEPLAWGTELPPIVFKVEALDGRRRIELFRREVDPFRRPEDRRWQRCRVALDPIAGVPSRLLFSVRPVKEGPGGASLPLWSDPTVWVPAPAAPPDPPLRPRSIVLVSLDTLRARSTSAYGHHLPTTPFLAELAASGTRFANAFTTSSNTFGGHMGMLTGAYAATHGEQDGIRHLSKRIATLAERLGASGFETAAFTEDGLLDADKGFARGFATYWENTSAADAAGDAPGTFARALRWAAAERDRPTFLFVHTYAVHSPYEPGPPYDAMFGAPDAASRAAEVELDLDSLERLRERMSGQLAVAVSGGVDGRIAEHRALVALLEENERDYEREVRELDAALEELVGGLEQIHRPEDLLLVVTADHGEEFGEHGGFLHMSLYEEVLHVPLLLRWTGRIPAGKVVDAPVSLVDLAPTIVRLGAPGDPPVPSPRRRNGPLVVEDGLPLLDLVLGDASDLPRPAVFASSPSGRGSRGWSFVGRARRHKCFFFGTDEQAACYDLGADPMERSPLPASGELAELWEATRAYARRSLRARGVDDGSLIDPGTEAARDPERFRKLQALGYVQ